MSQANQTPTEQGQYVLAHGLNIYYEEYGSGEPLVLLHGGLGNGRAQWVDQIPVYAGHFRVIMPDARAHGNTINPAAEFSTSILAEDVVALIGGLTLEKPLICGWSMGADTAVEIAIRHPGLAKAFVVGGFTHRISDTFLAGARALGIEGPGQVNFELTEKNNPQIVESARTIHPQGPDHWKTLLQQISTTMFTPPSYTTEQYQGISEPMLLMLGDRDQYIPVEDNIELYRLIPNSELAVFPQSDHSVARTRAGWFANIALDFMLRQSAQRPQQ